MTVLMKSNIFSKLGQNGHKYVCWVIADFLPVQISNQIKSAAGKLVTAALSKI